MKARARNFLYATLGLALGGCADKATEYTAPGMRHLLSARIQGTPSARERDDARLLARVVAAATADSGARRALFNAFASSSHREGKVHLQSYLAGRGRTAIAVAEKAGMRSTDIMAAVASVRDLEVYVPVAGHREKLRRGDTPQVGIALREEDNPVVVGVDGTTSQLPRDFAPSRPTIMLVANETDLSTQSGLNLRGIAEASCDVGKNETLDEAQRRCHPRSRPEEIARDEELKGLFLGHIELFGDQCGAECWFFGTPEYEIHVAWPSDSADTVWPLRSCTGPSASGEKRWNMEGRTWRQLQRLLEAEELDDALASGSRYTLMLWEDDHHACQVKTNEDQVRAVLGWTLAFGGAALLAWHAGGLGWAAFLGLVTVYDGVILMSGGDDFVGAIAPAQSPFPPQGNLNAVVVRREALIGRARIEERGVAPPVGQTVSVAIDQPSGILVPVGTMKGFEAAAIDAAGLGTYARATTWSSSNVGIASIDSYGALTANAPGSVTVTATIDGIASSVTVQAVTYGTVASATLTPNSISLGGAQYEQLILRQFDGNGFELPISNSSGYFELSAPGVCSVDELRIVRAAKSTAAWTSITARLDNNVQSNTVACSINGGAPPAGGGGPNLRAPK